MNHLEEEGVKGGSTWQSWKDKRGLSPVRYMYLELFQRQHYDFKYDLLFLAFNVYILLIL